MRSLPQEPYPDGCPLRAGDDEFTVVDFRITVPPALENLRGQ
jgi:hypothetical protein